MKFVVLYEEGVWAFEVVSTGDEEAYYESFELTDLDEAVTAAAELVEEIRTLHDPVEDTFRDLFDEDN